MSTSSLYPAALTLSRMNVSITPLLLLTTTLATAEVRTSANYSITAETSDAGGQRTTSANYTHVGSAGLVAGTSTVAVPAATAKAGYIAQLYDVAGLIVNSAQSSVDEGASLQLGAWQLLDDATFLAVNATSVTWGAAIAPVASISASGLATAEIVYQNTPASVQGSFGGFSGSLNLTVLNVATDDFGSYAGDGVGDDWQVQYFGLPPNAAAGPLLDPDGDGQNNLYEWVASLDPTDPASVFKLRIEMALGNANLFFGPVVPGRTYTLKYGFDLLNIPDWPTFITTTVTDPEAEYVITDTSAAASPRKFYRIEITQP